MPQSRDRRPRLKTSSCLPQGEERLTVTYLNGSFYPKGCHKVGTDALGCPPEHNQRKPPQAPQKEKMLPDGMTHRGNWADRRGRLSLQCSALLHRTNNLFTCQLSTRPLYLIIILNFELWILNYTWASASVDSHVPLGTLCCLQASCHPCIPC